MIDQSVIYVAATLISVGVSYGRLSAQIRAIATLQNKQARVISEMRDRLLAHLQACPLSNHKECSLRENPAPQVPTNGDFP
jgi:hypothetical protein